jgi:thioredoxin reductase
MTTCSVDHLIVGAGPDGLYGAYYAGVGRVRRQG